MNVENKITLNRFQPRWYQHDVFDALENKQYKRLLLVWPRRAGKDICSWNIAIRQCLKKVCLIFYVLPTYSQARKAIFDAIAIDSTKFIDYIPKQLIEAININEQKIRFKNGSILQCIGGDSYDSSLVGSNPYGIVLSEYALMSDQVFAYARPILAANDGWAIICSTPRGKNHFYHLYKLAQQLPDWYVSKMTVDDTQHIPVDVLAQERAQMNEELFQQEYYCFPPDQEVLCNDSVKSICDVKPDDLVISHSGRIRKVVGVINREYNGPLVEIISYGSPEPIRCTPDHPIRVYNQQKQLYSWKAASEILETDLLVFPKYQLSEVSLLPKSLCLVMAWYITEGSSFKNGVQFTVGNKEEVDRIVDLLKDINIDATVHELESAFNVVVNSVQLVDFLRVNCGNKAHTKRIPLSLIMGHEEDFFFELIKGDGCYSIHNTYEKIMYATVSKTLAYQVQMLANSLDKGFACGITIREASEGVFPGDRVCKTQRSYCLQINSPQLRSKNTKHNWLIRAKYGIAARIKSIRSQEYSGKVYNLKVQYDESYIVAGRAVHNCSFERGIEGSIYGRYLDRLRLNGQITHVPWEPGLMTYLSFDIGVNDATSIIWYQIVGDSVSIRIIDCYSNTGVGLDHYAKIIQDKPYRYGAMFAPHDIKVREWGDGAISRFEKARQLGLELTILDQTHVQDGIENVWTHFDKFWIDSTKCKSLVDALENYRKEWDDKRQTYSNKPLRNWSTHYADALRYLCQSLPRTKRGLTSEEFARQRANALYGHEGLPMIFSGNPDFDRKPW